MMGLPDCPISPRMAACSLDHTTLTTVTVAGKINQGGARYKECGEMRDVTPSEYGYYYSDLVNSFEGLFVLGTNERIA